MGYWVNMYVVDSTNIKIKIRVACKKVALCEQTACVRVYNRITINARTQPLMKVIDRDVPHLMFGGRKVVKVTCSWLDITIVRAPLNVHGKFDQYTFCFDGEYQDTEDILQCPQSISTGSPRWHLSEPPRIPSRSTILDRSSREISDAKPM